VLCTDGPVKTLAGLSLAPEHRRGHGALYDAIDQGHLDIGALSVALTAITLPRLAGRITLAVDVTPWLRPDAATSPDRLFCHVHGRRKDEHLLIPGWPYSMVAALEEGRTSWTRLIDARRLRPDDDEAAVTAAQVRDVVMRIIASGQHKPGDPDILLVFDACYDLGRLSFLHILPADSAHVPLTTSWPPRARRSPCSAFVQLTTDVPELAEQAAL